MDRMINGTRAFKSEISQKYRTASKKKVLDQANIDTIKFMDNHPNFGTKKKNGALWVWKLIS